MSKKILVGVAATLGIIALIVVSMAITQPDNYRVERSIEISAPASTIFQVLANLQKWPEWSPWQERDPNMEIVFSEQTTGLGAFMTWKSKTEGAGKMTLTEVIESQNLKFALEFYEPFQGTAGSDFSISEENGVARVIWGMDGNNKSFVDKVFYALMDFDSMIGKDYETGLDNLKKVVEAQ